MASNCVECTNCDAIAAMLSTPEELEFWVTQGQTWNELIAIPDLEFDSGCESYLTMRMSPGGREFARFTSTEDHIFLSSGTVSEMQDDGSTVDQQYGGVRLAVPAAAVAALVPLDYYYNWIVRCCGQSYVAASGIAHVLSNLAVGGVDCADTMPTVLPGTPKTITITSLNSNERICCGRHEPLFYKIAGGGITSINVSGGGSYIVQSKVDDQWVNDTFLTQTTTERRIVYYKYDIDRNIKNVLEQQDYTGGSADCDGCTDDECPESFTLTVAASNDDSVSESEDFSVTIDTCYG